MKAFESYIGRGIYLSFFLTILAGLAEGLGISLLLPLLHLFNNQEDVSESFGFKGYLFKLLETLNLHNSYRIILFLIILAFIVKGIFIFLTYSYNSFLKGRLLVSLKKRLFYSYSICSRHLT